VSALLYNTMLRPIVLAQVQALSQTDEPVAILFKNVFNAIAENQTEFGQLLTTWLLAATTKLAAVRSLLAMCAAGSAPVALDAPLFTAATHERQVIACRRLLTLTMDGPAFCRFIGILAEEPAFQPQGLAFASQLLPEAMKEFPGATEDFLLQRTRLNQRSQPYAPLYRSIYAGALTWRRVLRRLPRRGELHPRDSELHALRAAHQGHAQEVMRSARKHSIWALFATTIHTAQGLRFVSHMQHGTSAISAMAAHSHSIELPSSERSDPVGGLILRSRTLRGSK
jgi:hypothetical protein